MVEAERRLHMVDSSWHDVPRRSQLSLLLSIIDSLMIVHIFGRGGAFGVVGYLFDSWTDGIRQCMYAGCGVGLPYCRLGGPNWGGNNLVW